MPGVPIWGWSLIGVAMMLWLIYAYCDGSRILRDEQHRNKRREDA